MTLRDVLSVAVALALAACASGGSATKTAADPFAAVKFADSKRPEALTASAADANAYTIELAFERGDGKRLLAPRMTVFAGQAAQISMTSQVPYVADFDVQVAQTASIADPVVKSIEEGLRFDACAQRAADGGITFGYRISLSRVRQPIAAFTTLLASGPPVTIQVPEVDRAEVSGTRWIEPGVLGMLARVASPDGSGPMLVLARLTPLRVDAAPPGAAHDSAGSSAMARPMTGHTVHLRVSAVTVARDFEPGTVLDETSAPDVMKAAGGSVLRDTEVFTCLDSRVRLASLSGNPEKSQGLVAEMGDDGRLHVSWNGRTASVRPNAGRRFVAVAPVEGGGTAGVLVSVDADE